MAKDECKPKKATKRQKPKRQIEIVRAPGAFPISTTARARKRGREATVERNEEPQTNSGRPSKLLDWDDTAKEIRAYGATAFVGKQKRNYQDEEYLKLTGRQKKKPQTPLPILRGIKKAAAKREAKERQEAREAGIVLPKASKDTEKADSTYKLYGPAPNIGFMKGGVFRVHDKKAR
ncbi:unnamed protein product [Cylindrotheca closterium]|uniref:Uncharacterized protein n=1 Tax=Cylindrotheca closterium TaxID=2856 RepID=A0AAD2CQA9_9STRA|nr:unnamed protein product [Cylindrotheca closterium]